MACKHVHSLLSRVVSKPNYGTLSRLAYYHSSREEESPDHNKQEVNLPSEWCEKAFSKMNRWSHSLKDFDLIGGRLVKIDDHSRVHDDNMERKMRTFKSIARAFIGLPSMKETIRKNLMASFSDTQCKDLHYFCKPHETDELIVNSLTKVSDILNISAQQRKVVRHTVCPQGTQFQIWTGALVEILNELRSEIEVLIHIRKRLSKEIRLAQQIVVNCLKLLESAISHDPETSSWMRLTPTKGVQSNNSHKWEDVLEMSIDLINCLSDEKDLAFHVSKLEAMKEGLYQIRDVSIDKSIGYKEARYQEHLVKKKLTKNLGHSSRCLFTLLMYYLYGTVRDVEVEVRGGVCAFGGGGGGGKFCLYMGKILTVDDEKVVWNGVKELDRALGLFKFVRESAGVKGELELQGHLWCVGAKNRFVSYRGNMYFVHEINL